MTPLHVTAALLGLTLAATILILIRRNHLHLTQGVFWVAVAGLAVLFGLWVRLIDRLAGLAGIAYSPTLLLLVAALVLFVKALLTDVGVSRLEQKVRRLNQRVAMLEAELEDREPQ
jgi:hypothetical protein